MMSDVERPSFILYFIAKISVVIFPLSLLVNAILIRLGLPEDWGTFIAATIASYYVSEWYESLNNEVYLYVLREVVEERADSEDKK
jgi:hypothetical protein